MMLLTACSSSITERIKSKEASDGALCEELQAPIDKAVATTLANSNNIPPTVINDWTVVVKGFDAGCK